MIDRFRESQDGASQRHVGIIETDKTCQCECGQGAPGRGRYGHDNSQPGGENAAYYQIYMLDGGAS